MKSKLKAKTYSAPIEEVAETVKETVSEFAIKAKELSEMLNCEVYWIEGVVDGETVAMFLREPSFPIQKKIFSILTKDATDIITAGEYILTSCAIPNIGYDLWANERTRLSASATVVNLFDINDTLELKKN